MVRPQFPESVYRLKPDQQFEFDCHPGVPCFTECCRMLELALTPYDVLRMRRGTGLNSQQLHDRYLIEDRGEEDLFPKYYLTMVDDGRASCVFVDKNGCRIYPHRPGACRAYPLGRAAVQTRDGELKQHFVLLKETHCKGFDEPRSQSPLEYSEEQGLNDYNRFNDALAQLIQHPEIRQGRFNPTGEQLKLYSLALYNLDVFRSRILDGSLEVGTYPEIIKEDDEELLLFAIEFLISTFFTNQQSTDCSS